jgi:hypothetical protein
MANSGLEASEASALARSKAAAAAAKAAADAAAAKQATAAGLPTAAQLAALADAIRGSVAPVTASESAAVAGVKSTLNAPAVAAADVAGAKANAADTAAYVGDYIDPATGMLTPKPAAVSSAPPPPPEPVIPPFNPPTPADITKPTTPAQDRATLLATYGAQVALVDSVPELSALLNTAMAENWSAAKWTAEYQNTNWYQQHGAGYITSETDRLADPGKYAEAYNNLLTQMTNIAMAKGLDVSSFGGQINAAQAKAMDPSRPNVVAQMLQHYYNTTPDATVLSQYIAKNSKIALNNAGTPQGELATTAQSLRNYATSMGVSSQYLTPTWGNAAGATVGTSPDYFTNAAYAIQQGATTADTEQALYRQNAQAIYKPFAQQIANGVSVAQLAQPYLASASNLLEVDPTSISLGSTTGLGAKVTKALQGDGTNAMPLDAFNTYMKQQSDWLNTANARSSLMDVANTWARDFGKVAAQ